MSAVDPDVLAAWAEAKAGKRSTALQARDEGTEPRNPRGGQGAHILPDERREIQLAMLTTPGATVSGLARQFGRTREAISGCLKGEDFEAMSIAARETVRVEAIRGLWSHVQPAVDGWGAAVGIAAAKGDHRPSKELLESVGVIERTPDRAVAIQIAIGMPGAPVGPALDQSVFDHALTRVPFTPTATEERPQ